MEKRIDLNRVRKRATQSAKLFVESAKSQIKKSLTLGFKTWTAMEAAIAKARENDYRRRYGRSAYNPHHGARQLARVQRIGSPAWHGWKNAIK
jgi:hypothetical protein